MKKLEPASAARKHGGKARPVGSARLKTKLTFESASQAYLWITDRGRSKPLIKH